MCVRGELFISKLQVGILRFGESKSLEMEVNQGVGVLQWMMSRMKYDGLLGWQASEQRASEQAHDILAHDIRLLKVYRRCVRACVRLCIVRACVFVRVRTPRVALGVGFDGVWE